MKSLLIFFFILSLFVFLLMKTNNCVKPADWLEQIQKTSWKNTHETKMIYIHDRMDSASIVFTFHFSSPFFNVTVDGLVENKFSHSIGFVRIFSEDADLSDIWHIAIMRKLGNNLSYWQFHFKIQKMTKESTYQQTNRKKNKEKSSDIRRFHARSQC